MGIGMVSHRSTQLSVARLRKADSKVKLKRKKANEFFREIFLRERCLDDLYRFPE